MQQSEADIEPSPGQVCDPLYSSVPPTAGCTGSTAHFVCSPSAQQLLGEEDAEAAKAAARKAKKLRQKLKKQLQAKGSQPCLESEDAAASVDPAMQVSGAQLPGAQISATQHLWSPASAPRGPRC